MFCNLFTAATLRHYIPLCDAFPRGIQKKKKKKQIHTCAKKALGVRHKNLSDCATWIIGNFTHRTRRSAALKWAKLLWQRPAKQIGYNCASCACLFLTPTQSTGNTHTHTHTASAINSQTGSKRLMMPAEGSARNRTQMMNDKRNNRHTHTHD